MFSWLFNSSVKAPRWILVLKRQLSIRSSILLAYLAIVGGGFYMVMDTLMEEVGPRYLESMEESLVDTVNILASTVETEILNGNKDATVVRELFERAYERKFKAQIYSLSKSFVDLRVYVTDQKGIVLYDSHFPENIGLSYFHWQDVSRTLKGEYGARATRITENNLDLLVLYVAAPIYVDDSIGGVITVGKPTTFINELIVEAQGRLRIYGTLAALVILILGVVLSIFLTRPIRRLTRYAEAIRDGKPVMLPHLFGMEVNALGQAFEEMKDTLEGKQYVEQYAESLTHQLKSPLSGISGAAELLEGQMSAAERLKFLGNVRRESERMQRIIDRMLELTSLESRKEIKDIESVNLSLLIEELVADLDSQFKSSRVSCRVKLSQAVAIRAERFLIKQALVNLVQNAIEFSFMDTNIVISLEESVSTLEISVTNLGEEVPSYALDRAFDRFYSLPRAKTGQKSSGIGLNFVKEIMKKHGGRVELRNLSDGRVEARLIFLKIR